MVTVYSPQTAQKSTMGFRKIIYSQALYTLSVEPIMCINTVNNARALELDMLIRFCANLFENSATSSSTTTIIHSFITAHDFRCHVFRRWHYTSIAEFRTASVWYYTTGLLYIWMYSICWQIYICYKCSAMGLLSTLKPRFGMASSSLLVCIACMHIL